MINPPLILGLSIVDPVLMILTGMFMAAAIPPVFILLRRQRWRITLAQFMIALVPIALFAWGFAFHVRRCEAYRRFDSEFEKVPINPITNFLDMSRGYAILFMIAFGLSLMVLGFRNKQQSHNVT